MLIIDRFAYTNRLSRANPYIKVLLSVLLIFVSIINSNLYGALAIAACIMASTVLYAGIPAAAYIKMVIPPFIYLSISILTIILVFGSSGNIPNISDADYIYLRVFNHSGIFMGITRASLRNGLLLGLRSVCGIVSMYFLILTTPCTQQIKVMKKIRVPAVFIELYVLTYRFIAVFFEEAIQIHAAQKMKFGYINYRNSMNSLAILVKTLYVRMMIRFKDMESILEIKHFDGNFYVD